ncbi:DUF262 domain-containing protein [candidate division KSB1 bacterium]|nr:DUF262 domain-containing protein [candidate division KSB1 bacterium]
MKVSTILDHIDSGSMALPEFQRGYVWNRKQVKDLVDSLYRKHPVGSLLVWETKTETAAARGDGKLSAGNVKLILDGQQRITSLYGLIRGKEPKFFDGNNLAFTGLYFNLDTEEFEFYAPLKMKDNPFWIEVSKLMLDGLGATISTLIKNLKFEENQGKYIQRLTELEGIKNIAFHVDEVTGEDKTVDVVVDIFNRVNSGGTKLSKGDLALAKICGEWTEARDEMKKCLTKWRNAGFYFKLEWLLRCVNGIVTGESLFSYLKDVSIVDFQEGLKTAERRIDTVLNLVSSRLGLDHDRVLGSRYSFPVLVKYLDDRNGKFDDASERDKLLFWYIHTFLWGRYAGSTESVLAQDLNHIKDKANALDNIVEQLRTNRGSLKLENRDFIGWSSGARFYPLLYMLTRVWKARDLGMGIELSNALLGKMNTLEVHHVFPKSILYDAGHTRPEVNALANFMFLTKETNLEISNKNPIDYFSYYEEKNPGVLNSQWIPMDESLWKIENYRDFLNERRNLLANAANKFLESLYHGGIPEIAEQPSIFEGEPAVIPGSFSDREEEEQILQCNTWVEEQGLPVGEMQFELCCIESGDPLAIIDLAWPDGLQVGLSQPVAVILNEGEEIEGILNRLGYRFFINIESFKRYVEVEILAVV